MIPGVGQERRAQVGDGGKTGPGLAVGVEEQGDLGRIVVGTELVALIEMVSSSGFPTFEKTMRPGADGSKSAVRSILIHASSVNCVQLSRSAMDVGNGHGLVGAIELEGLPEAAGRVGGRSATAAVVRAGGIEHVPLRQPTRRSGRRGGCWWSIAGHSRRPGAAPMRAPVRRRGSFGSARF